MSESTASTQPGDSHGHFISVQSVNNKAEEIDTDPPLVSLKVTNPLTYIKLWWKKIIGNEGVDVRLKVKPLTAIALSVVVITLVFGLGKISAQDNFPFFIIQTNSSQPFPTINPLPTSAIEELKDTAYTGTLRYSQVNNKYYLQTTSAEAITLYISESINLSGLVGKRILAMGKYDKDAKIMYINDAASIEILSKNPTVAPTIKISATTVPSPTGY